MTKFAFCESVTIDTPWHIRILTSNELKVGGGVDTKALCGKEVYWDLLTEITPHHLTHCCRKCAEKFKEKSNDRKRNPKNMDSTR